MQAMFAHWLQPSSHGTRDCSGTRSREVPPKVPDAHLKLWPHSEMQWASSMQTRGSGRRGASAARRLLLPTRSGDTYSTRTLPSCTAAQSMEDCRWASGPACQSGLLFRCWDKWQAPKMASCQGCANSLLQGCGPHSSDADSTMIHTLGMQAVTNESQHSPFDACLP